MKIEWILPQEAMNQKISHQAGVIRAVSRVAHEKAAIAKGYLLAHRAEGYSYIDVTRGEVDSWVNLNDRPSKSNKFVRAAAAIEFGNKYGGGGIDVLGRTFGLTSKVTGGGR